MLEKAMGRHGRRAFQPLIEAALNGTRGRPLEGEGAGLRLLPWVGSGILAFVLLPLLPGAANLGNLLAAILLPISIAFALLPRWERYPAWLQALPSLLPFVMIGLVRGFNESAIAAYSPVVLLPVFWFALYGTRPELLVSVVCVGITYAVPSPALGSGYPATELVAALLWAVIAGIAGFTLSELVRQREMLAERLERTARTDALTGLPNRRAWDEELEREIRHAGRSGTVFCVALLDLDYFKQYNDLNGHPAGDSHLKEVASIWRDRLRSADLIARYGGEEFAVLLTATDCVQAQEVIEELRDSVPLEETVSAGVAEWNGSEPGSELFARADAALYQAKRTGRDRTVLATGGELSPA
ncbi:MAG TPA: GGDEF domain-containing protein [Solirubrobacterales bacterium]|nr:GGDEF domain-containing protein [Solirubrobacterales bacterium]